MVLVVFIALSIIGLKKSRQLQELRQELYPKVLNDLIKIVEE
ncbi:hypothetical protein [Robertmurraya sp. FSL R5-0851]